MQVHNQQGILSPLPGGGSFALNTGGIYKAKVKETLPNNEAVLEVLGRDVKVKMADSLSGEGKIAVEITGTKDGLPVAKEVTAPKGAETKPALNQTIAEGKPMSSDLKSAFDFLQKKGVTLDRNGLNELKSFMEKSEGTVQEKLATVEAAVKKQLPITSKVLHAVHSALHGESFGRAVGEILKAEGIEPSQQTRSLQDLGSVKSVTVSSSSAIEADSLEAIQQAIKLVASNPDLKQVLQSIQQILSDGDVTDKGKASIQQAVQQANAAIEKGQELKARSLLMSGLQEAGAGLKPAMAEAQSSYLFSEELLSALPAQSKDVIVTKITEKLSQAAIDFKGIQRDMLRNLSQLESQAGRPLPQTKPLLEATIKMLDNAILKSDFMLYTDMDTEKKLLKASSQLAEASKLLGRGQLAEAGKLVAEIKGVVEKIQFKPAEVRVQHMVSKELLLMDAPSLTKQAAASVAQSLERVQMEPGGRNLFEHIRNMGLTQEHDISHSLLTKGKPQEELSSSLKSLLLQMVQSDAEAGMKQKGDSILSQLTGQQLLSKTDTSGLQSMVMSIPFLLGDKVEGFKVFLQSKNGQQSVDWKNCSLYFLFETKKLGDVGIALMAVDRTLSIKVKNDKPGFEEKMQPLANAAKERLQSIGYEIGSIQFTKLLKESNAQQKDEAKPTKVTRAAITEKGFDFSV
ncbi:hypothetical protein [Jeotgalibacillus proteolyticus]|uniref:Flagellar hook-length control protein-like C-terminal domain-containing protein n=1 Tax=Jeotgalibacillus proteolyticus TaxID=2082395 RepID=A0A2S5GBF5_9BACL|nr:hypothetical protein [Jeotgalibacillus proteolyticus]PPA70251.1 hypothetical protein C4B60_11765 [Jeotgalibacillus proteolyticus]